MMRLVYIKWHDIQSMDSPGWLTKEEIDALDLAVCETVGYVVKETRGKRGRIKVMSTISDNDNSGGHVTVIPNGCVIEKKNLIFGE